MHLGHSLVRVWWVDICWCSTSSGSLSPTDPWPSSFWWRWSVTGWRRNRKHIWISKYLKLTLFYFHSLFARKKISVFVVSFTWISRTDPGCWGPSPNTHEPSEDTRRTCTSGSCTCTCLLPVFIKSVLMTSWDQQEEEGGKEEFHLELRVSWSCFWVTEEWDESGSECVLCVIVLRSIFVGELDQAVIVAQTGICFSKTPGTADKQQKFVVYICNTSPRTATVACLTFV